MNQVDPNKINRKKTYEPKFEWSFLAPKQWGVWLALGLLWILAYIPVKWRDALAAKIAIIAYNKGEKRREIAKVNLKLCFPEKSADEIDQMIRDNFTYAVQIILSYGEFWWRSEAHLNRRVKIHGLEHVQALVDEGKTAIFMNPHLLSLDVSVIMLASKVKMIGMMKDMKNDILNWLVINRRARFGGHTFHRDAGLRPLISAVKAGYFMFHLPDEDMGSHTRSHFFATQKSTLPVMGKLAKLTKAEVLPVVSGYDREQHCYHLYILPPEDRFPVSDDQEDADITNDQVEALISKFPEQYMWTFRMFDTQPEGKDHPYKNIRQIR